jgi:acetolactate synthase-1/2/3 large subunit
LQKLSVEFGIPCATTLMGTGTVSKNHPTYVGSTLASVGVFTAAKDADVILALGCKFSFLMGYGMAPFWNAGAQIVQVDIDPQMIGKNRPVAVGILGDLSVVLPQLYEGLVSRNCGKIGDPTWLPSILQAQQANIATSIPKMTSEKVPILPQRVIHDLMEFMGPSDILCIDGGDIASLTLNQLETRHWEPRSVLMSGGFGHLGTAIPYAIGAKLAMPDRNVFFITGDGAFLFMIQELDTAVRYETSFVGVVADNSSWGMIKNREKREFGRKRAPFCVDLPETEDCSNYVKIAQAFGAYAERATDPAEITPTLQRAFDSRKPAIVVVPIDFVEPPNSAILSSLGKLNF